MLWLYTPLQQNSSTAEKEEEYPNGDLIAILIPFPTHSLVKKHRMKKHLEAVLLSLKFILQEHNAKFKPAYRQTFRFSSNLLRLQWNISNRVRKKIPKKKFSIN